MTLASLYYESHVTIEPVFGDRLALLREICARWDFRVASLIMRRDAEDPGQLYRDDTFCSARDSLLERISSRTITLCRQLEAEGFVVLRAKVEDTVWDTRRDDIYGCLPGATNSIDPPMYYDPEYGDDRMCMCGHTYYRHFDSYDEMDPVGCKYCCCHVFKEAPDGSAEAGP